MLAMLASALALGGCSAEANEHRKSVIVVADESPWHGPLIARYRDVGYRTAAVGAFAPHPDDDLDTCCLWNPDRPRTRWGPSMLQDGDLVTFPDDVVAETVFTDYIAGLAAARPAAPFLACYAPGPAALTAGTSRRGCIDRLLQQLRAEPAPSPILVVAIERGDAGNSEVRLRLHAVGPGAANGVEERNISPDDVLPTLVGLTHGRGKMRPTVPR